MLLTFTKNGYIIPAMSYYAYNSDSIVDRIMARRWVFLSAFFLVFFFSYLFLVAIDFIPEPPKPGFKNDSNPVTVIEQQAAPITAVTGVTSLLPEATPELPDRIYIKKLDKEIKVINPVSRKVDDLDKALLSGVVRHPDSALLGQDGNVFILGHSSYLPQVYNSNFQAFNGIQNLEWGDTIEVTSDNQTYVYRVDKVYRATADDATVVPIAGEDKRLILATCNSFGKVSDRFIVEATEISVRPL